MSANVLTEIVVLKHAESVDRVLGNNWIEFYDHNGRRTDEKFPEKVLKLNEFGVPVLLPKRSMETIEEFITRLNMLTRLLPIKHRDCIGMLIAHGSTISVLGKYVNTDEMKLLPADKITRIFKMVPPLTSLSLQREASGWTVKSYPLKYSPLLRPLSKDPDCIAKFGSHK
uniref:Uncharacterized protein n=1 Tax=Trichuris muris TaxID=70415 RepID=A0A5S6QLX4_TRIMR